MEEQAQDLSPTSNQLLERGDLDELTRHVNDLVAGHRWDELVTLGDRCRLAFERGKQLWAVAAHIDYRLALEAPGRWGAQTLESGAGRFAFGPLPEVAASRHTWAQLSPYLHPTPQAAMAAHERVVRGENLVDDPLARRLPEVLELPLRLEPWEPSYALADYHPDRMEAPAPKLPALKRLAAGKGTRGGGPSSAPPRADEVCRALEDLVNAWTDESNGHARATGTGGRARDALAALGQPATELVELAPGTALAYMAWAAASGGAHGRRRGAAPGRFAAWWAVAAVGGLSEQALSPAALGAALAGMRWFAWGGGEPTTGWALRLAVEARTGPHQGQAWAIAATDAM